MCNKYNKIQRRVLPQKDIFLFFFCCLLFVLVKKKKVSSLLSHLWYGDCLQFGKRKKKTGEKKRNRRFLVFFSLSHPFTFFHANKKIKTPQQQSRREKCLRASSLCISEGLSEKNILPCFFLFITTQNHTGCCFNQP